MNAPTTHRTRTFVRRPRGFSLLEVLMALVVLLIGSLAAVMGMLASARSLRAGQDRLHQQVLVDATFQRARLHNKGQLHDAAVVHDEGAVVPSALGVGQAPWVMDPSPATSAPGDLGAGALFFLASDGTFKQCNEHTTPACPAQPTSCLDSRIPLHVFCREVASTRSGATSARPTSIQGAIAVTRWVRVVQRQRTDGETAASAVLGREVFAR